MTASNNATKQKSAKSLCKCACIFCIWSPLNVPLFSLIPKQFSHLANCKTRFSRAKLLCTTKQRTITPRDRHREPRIIANALNWHFYFATGCYQNNFSAPLMLDLLFVVRSFQLIMSAYRT